MNNRLILVRAVQIITCLFSSFSAFLREIAPPETGDNRFATGIGSFASLAILLFLSRKAQKKSYAGRARVLRIVAVCAFLLTLVSAIFYKLQLDKLTFPYPPESQRPEYVAGTEMSAAAKKVLGASPGQSAAEIVADFGGLQNRELVWSADSIRGAKVILVVNYLVMVICLATTIFCLSESLAWR